MAKEQDLENALNDIQEPKIVTPAVETPTPVTPPDKGTEVATPPAVVPPAETPAQTPETPTPPATSSPEKPSGETPATEPKLYAGKYTNVFDLTHSIQEAGKKLGKENKEFISLFEEAQKSGDWTKAEAKYKELNAEITKKDQEQKKAQEAQVTPEKVTTDTGMSDLEFHNLLLEQSQKRITNTAVVAKMARLAHSTDKRMMDMLEDNPTLKEILLRLPQTQDELDVLDVYLPTVSSEYKQTFASLYSDARKQAEDYIKIERESPVHNKSQQEVETKQINELMTKWNAVLPKEDVDSWFEGILKDQSVYELRSGIPYLRPNEILRRFVSDNADKLHTLALEKVKAEALNKGSMQTAETLKNLKEKSIQSIGSTTVAPQKKLPVKTDLTDVNQVRSLSSEEKQRAFDDAVKNL